jgi:hypothetical protein
MDNNILTADEINVLMDAISSEEEPWLGYVLNINHPDPKATREGWAALLHSAHAKLEHQLEAL